MAIPYFPPARARRQRALRATILALGLAGASALAATPTYTWNNVRIGGSGYVPALVAHPAQRGLFYARTDVGGAYRYDAANSRWIALNDWTPASNFNISGIETIALDPNDPNKLYMVAGMYYGTDSGVVLVSNDKGNTFTQVPLGFSTGANQAARQTGERLQVDPNVGSILFYGTNNYSGNANTNGLWKSTNGGLNWSKVSGFPALSSDSTGAGVSFVAFYKPSGSAGRATQTIFAGINTKTAEQTGAILYKSSDGGNTWSPVWGGPTGLLPQRGQIGPDGYLYITFSAFTTDSNGEHYGPDGLVGGQVWKYKVDTNQWTFITPFNNSNGASNYGFSGLAVDPVHPGTLVVNSIDRYDSEGETMFRSTDGGASWTDIVPNASFDTSAAPWNNTYGTVHNFGNWGGSVLDPFDVNHAFVTSGGGIWETKNLTAANTNWAFGQNGVEETAITALISPTPNQYNAYPLISGGWDVCGFTHASLTSPPSQFTNPTCSKVTSLGYAWNNSTFVVRVQEDGWNSGATKYYGAISWNGGYSWNPFSSNGPTTKGGGNVAVNTDGSTILWSAPDVVAYSNTAAYSWTTVSALPADVKVVADGYNPNLFYAYQRNTGNFYASGDKAASWLNTNSNPIAWADQLAATPGIQGDLWLVTYNGLYHSTSSGWGSWTRTPGVTQATALGFGKAAAGASYPAMYVAGTVNSVRGFYRSTDGGNTWVQINDAAHQWAGSNVITGDPKVFGTVYIGTNNGRGIVVGTSSN